MWFCGAIVQEGIDTSLKRWKHRGPAPFPQTTSLMSPMRRCCTVSNYLRINVYGWNIPEPLCFNLIQLNQFVSVENPSLASSSSGVLSLPVCPSHPCSQRRSLVPGFPRSPIDRGQRFWSFFLNSAVLNLHIMLRNQCLGWAIKFQPI